jgi:hypothetical protein
MKMKKYLFVIIWLFTILFAKSQSTAFQWAKQMGGIGGDVGYAVSTDAQGNVYTTGYFSNTSDFDPGPGTYTLSVSGHTEMFISKLDASGNFLWAKQFAGSATNYGKAIKVDALGNIYTTGYYSGVIDLDPNAGTYTLSANAPAMFISKLDASGNFVWAKQFVGVSSTTLGLSLEIDALGNVYTTGNFNGPVDFDPGAGTYILTMSGIRTHAFISKLDAAGNFVWAKQLGGEVTVNGYSIISDAQSNIYVSGSFVGAADFDPGAGTFSLTTSTLGQSDVFVSKLDASGNFIWAKGIGGVNLFDEALAMTVDLSGNVYTTGYYTGTADFDPGVGVFNLISEGGKDIFISKLDANGNFVWAKTIGGIYDDYGRGIALDALNNVYTTGSFKGSADFNPGSAINYLVSGSFNSSFISKLDVSGNYVWAEKMGGTNSADGYAITLDAAGNIFTTGNFAMTVDFDGGPGVFNLISLNNFYDIFILKTGQTTAGVKENFNLSSISVYPNPANQIINIELESDVYQSFETKNLNIQLINALGEVVLSSSFEDGKIVTFNIENFNSGLYFVKIVSDNNSMLTKKIIKN